MNAKRVTRTLVLAALLACAVAVPPSIAAEGATLAALKLAYHREINAEKHYLAFAKGAERAGESRVAHLFRAVARGEAVHAASHLAQIERLGASVTPVYESVVVRDPASNLVAAAERERVERLQVYRAFAECARTDCDYAALAVINYARNAEGTHEERFREVLTELRRRPGVQMLAGLAGGGFADLELEPVESGTFCTCLGCGSVFVRRPAKSCEKCGTSGDRFETFGGF